MIKEVYDSFGDLIRVSVVSSDASPNPGDIFVEFCFDDDCDAHMSLSPDAARRLAAILATYADQLEGK